MDIALINASPKQSGSASGVLLCDLKSLIPGTHTTHEFSMRNGTVTEDQLQALYACSAWVFSFPLYVDGVPSHLLSCLCQLARCNLSDRKIMVYAVANAGFYEGGQTRNALEIMKNWCGKTGLIWGMGVGFGGGGALGHLNSVPLGRGPKRSLGPLFQTLADALLSRSTAETLYASIHFPRFLYRQMAEFGWWQTIRANGGKRRDLERRLP